MRIFFRRLAVGDDFKPRFWSSLILMIASLVLTFVGGWLFAAFWAIAAFIIACEWQALIGGRRLLLRVVLNGTVILALAFVSYLWLLLTLLGMAALIIGMIAGKNRYGSAGLGAIYASVSMLAPVVLRADAIWGLTAMLWMYAIVWGGDVGAYFGGRILGGPKLCAVISPNKTWAGAVMGALSSVCLGTALAIFVLKGSANVPVLVVLSLVLSLAAQAGDMLESALKRQAGVKDSGRLIPGHGGVMDRLDGFVVAAAFAVMIGYIRSAGMPVAPALLLW